MQKARINDERNEIAEKKQMKVVSSFDFEGEDSGDDEASEDSRDMHADRDRDRETDRQMEVENRAPPDFMPIVKANSTEVFPVGSFFLISEQRLRICKMRDAVT